MTHNIIFPKFIKVIGAQQETVFLKFSNLHFYRNTMQALIHFWVQRTFII
jgi:hypothetical protein